LKYPGTFPVEPNNAWGAYSPLARNSYGTKHTNVFFRLKILNILNS
jgi:hypothetical protein